MSYLYLQYFYYTLFIVCDVYCLKNFTVFATTQLADTLVVVLLAVCISTKRIKDMMSNAVF